MAAVYQKVLQVITKPPKDRTLKEIGPLLPWIRKKSELFKELKQDVVEDIIRNCEFVTRQADDIIIKQGDKGDCFYIILTGKVSVFINQLISDEEAGTEELANTHKGGTLDRSKFGNFIVHIDAGKSFGELALINKDCVRNASIIVDEETDLLVVNRELYNRSLRAAQTAEFEARKRFIAENQLFHNWQQKYKKQLAMSLRKEVIQFDGHIVKQGEPAVVLYFILRGTAKIVVDPSHHSHQFPNIKISEDPEHAEKSELTESILSLQKSGDITQRLEKVPPSTQRKKEPKRRSVEVSLVGENEIIGDVEFGLDLPTYIHSLVCTQQCEVYTLNMKNYERLVAKRNKPTVDQMRDSAALKLLSRASRVTECQVPLYRVLYHKIYTIQQKAEMVRKKREGKTSTDDEDHMSGDIVPPRGPLIDLFGPGTVFHRSRMRDQARRKQLKYKQSTNFRGASNFGATISGGGGNYQSSDYEQTLDEASEMNNNGNYYIERRGANTVKEGNLEGPVYCSRGANVNPKKQFHDRDSSDQALTMLETKIKQWHAEITKKPSKDTIKLKRVDVENEKDLKPGKTIYMRLKRADKRSPDNLTTKSEPIGLQNGRMRHSDFGNGVPVYPTSEGPENPPNSERMVHKMSFKRQNPTRRQYTLEEYKELKSQLLYKERTIASWITHLY